MYEIYNTDTEEIVTRETLEGVIDFCNIIKHEDVGKFTLTHSAVDVGVNLLAWLEVILFQTQVERESKEKLAKTTLVILSEQYKFVRRQLCIAT